LGVAIHAVDLGKVKAGSAVAVVGCGPIGLMVVQLARLRGASRVIAVDPLAHRQEAARRLGADLAVAPEEVPDVEVEVDVAFEVAGPSQAVDLAVSLARPGGRVVLVGIPDDDTTSFRASAARRKGLTLLLSRRMGDVYQRAIDLVEQNIVDVDSIVTHRFGLTDVGEAFETAAHRRGHKVLVLPGRSEHPDQEEDEAGAGGEQHGDDGQGEVHR
jgi:L-iditol 2-dehydrogenase